jgi:hypothetical protein
MPPIVGVTGIRVRHCGARAPAEDGFRGRSVERGVVRRDGLQSARVLAGREFERFDPPEATYQSFPVGVAGHAIFLTDTDGTIEYANPAVESVTGYEPADVVGKNPRLWKSGEHDDAFYAPMWGTITSGSVWDGEIINRRKSGDLCWVDMTIAPITDDAGTVERYVAVETDVTERKERQRRIEEQNDRLELLNRTNAVLRDVNRDLVAASTRDAVETAVCRRFADSELFESAWIGERGLVDGTLRSRTAANVDEATLDEARRLLEETEPSPIDRALDEGAPVFVTGEAGPTGTAAASDAVVPLTYREANYGVLVVRAERTDAFDAIDRSLFADLGATVADAISAIESRRTLATDDVTELEFRLDGVDDPLVDLSAALGCSVELERIADDGDDRRALYCTVQATDPGSVTADADDADHVDALCEAQPSPPVVSGVGSALERGHRTRRRNRPPSAAVETGSCDRASSGRP